MAIRMLNNVPSILLHFRDEISLRTHSFRLGVTFIRRRCPTIALIQLNRQYSDYNQERFVVQPEIKQNYDNIWCLHRNLLNQI
jgi:hypothetical protein